MAVLTTSLVRLRADFNTLAPNRDKASDGWIGDPAHASRTSGHNPDESGGGEYEDADTKDEVRAVDVDKDLRVSGLTMQMCINKILATPNDRNRLRYIIFNRVIWSASDGWRPRAYTGANAHDQHAHFSGDPADDENAQPWSILSLREDDMAELGGTEKGELQAKQLRDTHYTATSAINDPTGEAGNVPLHVWAEWLTGQVKELGGKVDALETNDIQLSQADLDTLATLVADKLLAAAVQAGAQVQA